MAIATIVAVTFMSIKVTTNQSGFGDYITYRTILKDATGIFPKTPIRVAGINAGRIKLIELQGNNALITFEVLKEIQVTDDSRLRIKSVGFLGDKYLEIALGRSPVILEPMGFLIAEEGGGMEDLLADAGEVLKDVKAMSGSFRDVFAPENQENPMKKIVDNLEALTANLNDTIVTNKDKLASLVDNLEKMSQSLAEETNRDIDDSSLSKLRDILTSTQKLTEDLQLLTQDIRQGKGTIGKLLVEDEIADEVRQTLAGVQRIVSRVDSLRSEIVVFTGANTRTGGRTEAYMKIFPSPERYYLLGLSTSKFGVESETIRTTIANGAESTRIEKEQDKDTYRFNVQLGRRVHQWGFRGGLIDSTGGVGVDYYIPKYGMRLTSEVFDYRKDVGVNFRLGAEFQLWNVIYGKVTGEDLAEETRSGTVSAGLRFTDEDLKGLIGLFL